MEQEGGKSGMTALGGTWGADGFYPGRWSSKGRGRLQPAFCNLWVPVGKESIFSWPREGFLSSGLSRIDKDGIDPMSISFPQATPERCLCISTV